MEDKTYIMLGIVYLILAIILVVVVLVLINKHDKKKLQGILTNLELDKNLIISANILTELNKVGSLINNKNLEIKYNNWKERYKQIKEVDMPSLENKLNDLSIEEHYKYYEDKGYEKKEIIKLIAKDRNVNKNEIYKLFI